MYFSYWWAYRRAAAKMSCKSFASAVKWALSFRNLMGRSSFHRWRKTFTAHFSGLVQDNSCVHSKRCWRHTRRAIDLRRGDRARTQTEASLPLKGLYISLAPQTFGTAVPREPRASAEPTNRPSKEESARASRCCRRIHSSEGSFCRRAEKANRVGAFKPLGRPFRRLSSFPVWMHTHSNYFPQFSLKFSCSTCWVRLC